MTEIIFGLLSAAIIVVLFRSHVKLWRIVDAVDKNAWMLTNTVAAMHRQVFK